MKTEIYFPRRIAAAALVAGLAGAGVAASASQADCPAHASAQAQAPGCGTTHPTSSPNPGGKSGEHRQADPQQGILPISAHAQPILDQSVTLDGATGSVLVKAPNGSRFVP